MCVEVSCNLCKGTDTLSIVDYSANIIMAALVFRDMRISIAVVLMLLKCLLLWLQVGAVKHYKRVTTISDEEVGSRVASWSSSPEKLKS
jgi:hypothetical protein